MYSLRRFHKFVVLAVLVWLPMSVFAQICATHAVVSQIGGPQHPALIVPEESNYSARESFQLEPPLAAVNAANFWQSVDDYDAGCDMKSMCAFASLSALAYTTTHAPFIDGTVAPSAIEIAFSTRSLTPVTPPPRA